MTKQSERVLYAGTASGLYRIDEEDGEFEASLIGFQGMGGMRAPVITDLDDPHRLYSGTTKAGFFVSEDQGETWNEANQGIVHKDLWSIAQHPDTKRLWIGTSPADIFYSDDRGDTWHECDSLLTLSSTRGWHGPVPPHISRMKCLALDSTDPDKIYGAIEEGWCVRTLDGGATWENLSEGTDHDSHAIYVMPDDPATIISTGGKGVFRSTDRGTTWVQSKGLEDYLYTPAYVVINPRDPTDLLTTTTAVGPGGWMKSEGPGVAFARSHDQGKSWQVLPESTPAGFRPVPRGLVGDREDMDVCFAGMTDGSVWMSHDGAEHFDQVIGGLPAISSLSIGYR